MPDVSVHKAALKVHCWKGEAVAVTAVVVRALSVQLLEDLRSFKNPPLFRAEEGAVEGLFPVARLASPGSVLISMIKKPDASPLAGNASNQRHPSHAASNNAAMPSSQQRHERRRRETGVDAEGEGMEGEGEGRESAESMQEDTHAPTSQEAASSSKRSSARLLARRSAASASPASRRGGQAGPSSSSPASASVSAGVSAVPNAETKVEASRNAAVSARAGGLQGTDAAAPLAAKRDEASVEDAAAADKAVFAAFRLLGQLAGKVRNAGGLVSCSDAAPEGDWICWVAVSVFWGRLRRCSTEGAIRRTCNFTLCFWRWS